MTKFICKVGDKVWISGSPNRWVCGQVKEVGLDYVLLERASFVNGTGGPWGDALRFGCLSPTWASEYLGEVGFIKKTIHEIEFMPPSTPLPKRSYRPNHESFQGQVAREHFEEVLGLLRGEEGTSETMGLPN